MFSRQDALPILKKASSFHFKQSVPNIIKRINYDFDSMHALIPLEALLDSLTDEDFWDKIVKPNCNYNLQLTEYQTETLHFGFECVLEKYDSDLQCGVYFPNLQKPCGYFYLAIAEYSIEPAHNCYFANKWNVINVADDIEVRTDFLPRDVKVVRIAPSMLADFNESNGINRKSNCNWSNITKLFPE